MVDKLEHTRCEQSQRSTVDSLPVRIITYAKNLRTLRIIDVQGEVVTRQDPV